MHVTLCVSDLDWFLTFLESFPNLRLLILELDAYEGMRSEDMDRITFSSVVPECLLSSLEYVDFNTQILGYAAEMKLVKYFLENSEVLKKLTLHVNHGSRDSDIAKELLKIPRRSASATWEDCICGTCRFRSNGFVVELKLIKYFLENAAILKILTKESLPQFHCMSRLCVTLCVSDLKCLPTFLESCPNLKSLILALDESNEPVDFVMSYKEMHYEGMNQMSFSSVPECLLSSLEFVDFESPISGYAAEMKLVKYFLENTTILKILTLRVNHGSRDHDFSKELLKIPRRSATCQIVVI
ncbi:unnamed protein product, partial [Thlaspi arvense]